jgi:RHS repeat-associated protein
VLFVSLVVDYLYDALDDDGAVGPDLIRPSHSYLWGQAVDQILAQENIHSDGAGGFTSTPNDLYWTLVDRLGSVGDANNASGTVQIHNDYDAFGKTHETIDYFGGGSINPYDIPKYQYTGKPLDSLTGLYDYGRPYNPDIGRFYSEDSAGLKYDSNLYRYCYNNVVNMTDPTGNCGYNGSIYNSHGIDFGLSQYLSSIPTISLPTPYTPSYSPVITSYTSIPSYSPVVSYSSMPSYEPVSSSTPATVSNLFSSYTPNVTGPTYTTPASVSTPASYAPLSSPSVGISTVQTPYGMVNLPAKDMAAPSPQEIMGDTTAVSNSPLSNSSYAPIATSALPSFEDTLSGKDNAFYTPQNPSIQIDNKELNKILIENRNENNPGFMSLWAEEYGNKVFEKNNAAIVTESKTTNYKYGQVQVVVQGGFAEKTPLSTSAGLAKADATGYIGSKNWNVGGGFGSTGFYASGSGKVSPSTGLKVGGEANIVASRTSTFLTIGGYRITFEGRLRIGAAAKVVLGGGEGAGFDFSFFGGSIKFNKAK